MMAALLLHPDSWTHITVRFHFQTVMSLILSFLPQAHCVLRIHRENNFVNIYLLPLLILGPTTHINSVKSS